MDNNSEAIRVLGQDEIIERLRGEPVGRIVVRRKDDMDIFPVNYVVDTSQGGPRIYLRTAEGTKLFTVNLNPQVLFEVNHFNEESGWSVVVRGTAYVVKDTAEIHHAESFDLRPWLPTLKYNFICIPCIELSGRAFTFGEEPERY
ncbi:pyridoxamine 5'-phosphate oxidase family protein [Corynebacterium pseudotuberculosis]|uniref:pyridoxamine 5'-phosphate oxidase family protein n=1 Tax=Corynebacterium pseudotuberculosis TaxID=1719 RepID=UPI0035160A70